METIVDESGKATQKTRKRSLTPRGGKMEEMDLIKCVIQLCCLPV